MNIKKKFSLLKRNTETREIGGQTFTFYPISVRMLFELKSSMEPLMKALKTLFPKETNDGTTTTEETFDPSTRQMLTKVTHLGATPLDTVKFRVDQDDKAMRESIEAILGEKNRLLMGRVLADSLRDEEIKTDTEISEFICSPEFDLPLMVEFLSGFFAVNVKVFGPFVGRVKDLVKQRFQNLTPNPASDSAPAVAPETPLESNSPFGTVSPPGS
jgi:hypothetical protein